MKKQKENYECINCKKCFRTFYYGVYHKCTMDFHSLSYEEKKLRIHKLTI